MKTTQENTKVYAAIALLALAGAGYWYYKKRKEQENDDDDDMNLFRISPLTASTSVSNTPTKVSKPTPSTPKLPTTGRFRCSSSTYPLAYGTCHADVKILQAYLKKNFNASLGASGKHKNGVDGMYGTKTNMAAHKHLGKPFFTKSDINGMRDANSMILV